MSANETKFEIDTAAIEAELAGLSEEQLAAEVLKVRTKQKVQQKRMQGSESHKKYQAKAQAKRKLLIQLAKDRGIYDSINEQAEARAEELILAEAGEETATADAQD